MDIHKQQEQQEQQEQECSICLNISIEWYYIRGCSHRICHPCWVRVTKPSLNKYGCRIVTCPLCRQIEDIPFDDFERLVKEMRVAVKQITAIALRDETTLSEMQHISNCYPYLELDEFIQSQPRIAPLFLPRTPPTTPPPVIELEAPRGRTMQSFFFVDPDTPSPPPLTPERVYTPIPRPEYPTSPIRSRFPWPW